MNILQIIEYKDYYHNKNLFFFDPKKLVDLLTYIPYKEVKDALIEAYLNSNNFIDTNTNWFTMFIQNNIDLKSEQAIQHHAQRIASLINLLRKNVDIDEIHIYSNRDGTEILLENGNHRLRSYLYLSKFIPVSIFFGS